jgi:hypothetical protein
MYLFLSAMYPSGGNRSTFSTKKPKSVHDSKMPDYRKKHFTEHSTKNKTIGL